MDWYGMIKRYYDANYWTDSQVKQAVSLGKISPDQYQQITGQPYSV